MATKDVQIGYATIVMERAMTYKSVRLNGVAAAGEEDRITQEKIM